MTAAAWGVSLTRTRFATAPARCDWKQRRMTHRWNYACTTTALDFRRDFLPRAFERFSRADGPRGATGAGLGLAIVAAIARDTQAA